MNFLDKVNDYLAMIRASIIADETSEALRQIAQLEDIIAEKQGLI